MRSGYILLHRKGITRDEWRHPKRTLAWIDFCTLAAYENYMAEDGVWIRKGEVIASYGFLANRWRTSKGTVHFWMTHWIDERQVERLPERCIERNAERLFIVNYAKYQEVGDRTEERTDRRSTEPKTEQKKRRYPNENTGKENIELSFEKILDELRTKSLEMEFTDEAYAEKTMRQAHQLSKDDRERLRRKISVFLNCCKSRKWHSKARVIFGEIAGFVNDRGDMQRQLTDEEKWEREEFRDSMSDQ
jgi:hypothetical protein